MFKPLDHVIDGLPWPILQLLSTSDNSVRGRLSVSMGKACPKQFIHIHYIFRRPNSDPQCFRPEHRVTEGNLPSHSSKTKNIMVDGKSLSLGPLPHHLMRPYVVLCHSRFQGQGCCPPLPRIGPWWLRRMLRPMKLFIKHVIKEAPHTKQWIYSGFSLKTKCIHHLVHSISEPIKDNQMENTGDG